METAMNWIIMILLMHDLLLWAALIYTGSKIVLHIPFHPSGPPNVEDLLMLMYCVVLFVGHIVALTYQWRRI